MFGIKASQAEVDETVLTIVGAGYTYSYSNGYVFEKDLLDPKYADIYRPAAFRYVRESLGKYPTRRKLRNALKKWRAAVALQKRDETISGAIDTMLVDSQRGKLMVKAVNAGLDKKPLFYQIMDATTISQLEALDRELEQTYEFRTIEQGTKKYQIASR